MPPNKASNRYEKRVEFVAKQSDEQVAVGVVMVPDKVDLQGDYVRPDTIAGFAEQFAALETTGDAGGGVMHAVWPDEWLSLERNETLDEATTIGGRDVPSGAWIQAWKFEDDGLWKLVEDGILEGYSIGGVDMDWSAPLDVDDLPDDVTVADGYDSETFWEIRGGIIREVSAVDSPAVPDALIHETKAGADKRLADHLGDREGFVEEAMDRGHSEAAAERLWDVLDRAAEVEGAGRPGKQSMFGRAGKAFLDTLLGRSTESSRATEQKEGRTLSRTNRDALFASIDAQLGVLEDAGIDHGTTRFSDRDDIDFDIAEFDGKAANDDHAPGGVTPDTNDTQMSDNPDDDKSLAERNAERLNSIEEKLTDIADGDGKEADADPEDDDVAERIDDLEGKIDDLAAAAGKSQQLEGGNGGSDDAPSKADVLGLPGGGD